MPATCRYGVFTWGNAAKGMLTSLVVSWLITGVVFLGAHFWFAITLVGDVSKGVSHNVTGDVVAVNAG